MHLQIVGCGDAFGTGGRFNTCFHLVGKNVNALIDCGASSLVGMNKLAIDRNAVSTILITHFHADHVGGVPFFILEANYVLKRKGRADHCRTARPQSALRRNDGERLSGTANLQLSFPLTLHEVEIGKRNEISGMKVTPVRVVHDERAGPCLGYRCEVEGKTVAYSGDTQWTDAVIDIGRNADLFICEAYTRDKPINTHMALSALEKHLGEIKPKRLILTHMGIDMLAHRAEVPYETADDGKIVEL